MVVDLEHASAPIRLSLRCSTPYLQPTKASCIAAARLPTGARPTAHAAAKGALELLTGHTTEHDVYHVLSSQRAANQLACVDGHRYVVHRGRGTRSGASARRRPSSRRLHAGRHGLCAADDAPQGRFQPAAHQPLVLPRCKPIEGHQLRPAASSSMLLTRVRARGRLRQRRPSVRSGPRYRYRHRYRPVRSESL